MDHLCELPNDASRRKALGNLPPTLTATYERILRRVNASNMDVQLLVSRTLRWVIYGDTSTGQLSTAALCEAVSIDLSDTQRDNDNISDKTEILRWCSSLVRQAADDDYLELAHFTVKEFLQGIKDEDSGEFAAYRIGAGHGEEELAKVCLTYLNFQDFDQDVAANDNFTTRRLKAYPFREYAVDMWNCHAQDYMHDSELLSMTKRLLNPSKPNTLISWAQDLIYLLLIQEKEIHELYDRAMDGIAEASALHYAAILAIPEICTWLVDNGCDVNRVSIFGTPYQCALMGSEALSMFGEGILVNYPWPSDPQKQKLTYILSSAGADLHSYKTSFGTYSPLFLSLYYSDKPLAVRLLEEGAMIDDRCLTLLEASPDTPGTLTVRDIIDHVTSRNVHEKDTSQLLRLRIAAGRDPSFGLMEDGGGNRALHSADYGPALRAAAKHAQMDVILQLLRRENIDVDDVDKADGITALHLAAMTDHLDMVKLLQTHGAKPKKVDCKGRAAIHHAIKAISADCLEYFLNENNDELPRDNDGYSLWHLAALEASKEKLDVLARYRPLPRFSSMTSTDGWSPLLCAASVGSLACVEWLIRAGCDVTDVANDGNTALHLAIAAESGSLETTEILIAGACNVNSLGPGGSTPLMIAARLGRVEIMDLLIHQKADLRLVDKNGCNVVHYACDGGHLRTVQRLRYTDVDWNARGKFSRWSRPWQNACPLHVAAKNYESDVLEYLLDEGLASDINATTIVNDVTYQSATALEISIVFSYSSIVSALLSRNAESTARCSTGELPIHFAARQGNLAVIAAFLEHGCDGEVPNAEGVDCETIAMDSGHTSAAKMFKDHKLKRGEIGTRDQRI
ncbi:MAG: hypothetical protein L6R38_004988 [Xanthoria sp. 2 TBL-2021]|nr:MAG: hypothetical protein L6R38_004988 [Xanthoria sp. 2 TBL-2021]